MQHTRETKQLEGVCKGILSSLSANYGYDFSKPFETFKGNEKFTLNTIKKRITDIESKKVIIIIADSFNVFGEQLFQVAQAKKDSLDWKIFGGKHLTRFWKKSDFEEARKRTTLYYVIAQKNSDLRTGKKEDEPLLERVKIVKIHNKLFMEKNICQLTYYYANYGKCRKYESYLDYNPFDKSGYNTLVYKRLLLQRVEERKKAKLALELENLDTKHDLSMIKSKLEEIRSILTKRATYCPMEYNNIRDLRDDICNYGDLVWYYQKFAEKCEDKKFESVEGYHKSFYQLYENIIEFKTNIK